MMRGVRGLIAPLACAVVIVGVPAVAQARTLYVPNSGSNTVSTIDTATNAAGAALTFPSGSGPVGRGGLTEWRDRLHPRFRRGDGHAGVGRGGEARHADLDPGRQLSP